MNQNRVTEFSDEKKRKDEMQRQLIKTKIQNLESSFMRKHAFDPLSMVLFDKTVAAVEQKLQKVAVLCKGTLARTSGYRAHGDEIWFRQVHPSGGIYEVIPGPIVRNFLRSPATKFELEKTYTNWQHTVCHITLRVVVVLGWKNLHPIDGNEKNWDPQALLSLLKDIHAGKAIWERRPLFFCWITNNGEATRLNQIFDDNTYVWIDDLDILHMYLNEFLSEDRQTGI